jgi:predicted ribosome quality control (RQC) complex YloA/Tae2 family protein|tara:strand:+ start:976 stop:1446 length:471 start_codon:yes stop_codon:yes gene_type:complete
MSTCTCSSEKAEEVEEIKEAPEAAEALEEPVREEDLDKEDELHKDLEETLGKLKEVMAYLSDMAESKMEEEPGEDEEEEEEEEAEEEEEEEEKSSDPKEKDTLEKSLATLKKYGFNVYAGKKATPAPKIDTPKAETIDWMNVEKSWEELDEIVGRN